MADAVRLTGANLNTLKSHLRALVAQNQLRAQSSGRGVRYEIS